jgi:hypothetical protein
MLVYSIGDCHSPLAVLANRQLLSIIELYQILLFFESFFAMVQTTEQATQSQNLLSSLSICTRREVDDLCSFDERSKTLNKLFMHRVMFNIRVSIFRVSKLHHKCMTLAILLFGVSRERYVHWVWSNLH